MNSARSIQSLAQQASAYVTVSTSPASLPGYVDLDGPHDWISSALMVTAIETVTLPSRLRQIGGRQASLSLLAEMLDTDGKQNVFELAVSVPQRMFSEQANGSADGGKSTLATEDTERPLADSPHTAPAVLDIRFATELLRRSQGTSAHIFSQALIQRGLIDNSEVVGGTDQIMGAYPSTDSVVQK